MRWLALVLVAAGCGSSPGQPAPTPTPTPDTAQSGSRLKLAWYDFGDGLRTWVSASDLYDAQLGTACSPMPWSDGTTRCTPPLSGIGFTDAACTQAVMLDDGPYGAAVLAQCGEPAATGPLYTPSATTVVAAKLWIPEPDGACIEQDPPYNPLTLTTGVPHDPSMLATITTVEAGGAGRMEADTLVSDDGLIVPLAPHDHQLDVSCDATDLVGTSSTPCRALGAPDADDLYSDAACTVAATWVPAGDCPTPLAYVDTDTCPEYHPVGGATGAMGYMGPFGCAPTGTAIDGSMVHTLGPAVPSMQLSRAPVAGTSRVELEYLDDGGGDRFRDPRELYDTELATDCRMVAVADGARSECRPDGHVSARTSLYGDASCQTPIPGVFLIEYGDDTCTPRTPPAFLTIDFFSATSAIYTVGPQHAGPIYQAIAPTCTQIPWPMYEVGAQLAPAQLPTATKIRDN